MAKIRVGVLGMTHDHVWSVLASVVESPLAELVGVADPAEDLGAKAHGQYGIPGYTSYDELLEKGKLDAALVYGDNAGSVELVEMAADRGVHVLVEKPLAATLEGADRMVAACARAGTQLMVNWPFAWWPQFAQALREVEAGRIGRPFYTKYRAAHNGPKELGSSYHFYDWLYDSERNGAGALMDYCSYGAALATHILGQPSRVTGTVGRLVKDYYTVDDNAIITMQWPRAMALAEASWSQIGHLTSYITTIYGTEGTLLVEPRKGGRLLMASAEHDMGEELEVAPLPESEANAAAYFLSHISEGKPIRGICSGAVGRDAQEILEAGLISAETGMAVSLPLPVSGNY